MYRTCLILCRQGRSTHSNLIGDVCSAFCGCTEFNLTFLEDVKGSAESVASSLGARYQRALLFQLYKFLGSLDALGNPATLFKNVGSGVMDFFYEPAKGLVNLSPQVRA